MSLIRPTLPKDWLKTKISTVLKLYELYSVPKSNNIDNIVAIRIRLICETKDT